VFRPKNALAKSHGSPEVEACKPSSDLGMLVGGSPTGWVWTVRQPRDDAGRRGSPWWRWQGLAVGWWLRLELESGRTARLCRDAGAWGDAFDV